MEVAWGGVCVCVPLGPGWQGAGGLNGCLFPLSLLFPPLSSLFFVCSPPLASSIADNWLLACLPVRLCERKKKVTTIPLPSSINSTKEGKRYVRIHQSSIDDDDDDEAKSKR